MEEVDSSAMCPSNSVYLLTLCMDLSTIQVINVIINSLIECTRQSVQVCRGKRQGFLTTGKKSGKPTLKAQVRQLKFCNSNSSGTSSHHFGLIRDVMF